MNNTQNKKEVLLQVGEKCVVEFVDVSYEGLGVCKVNAIDLKGNFYENYPIFVEGTLYNEKGMNVRGGYYTHLTCGHPIQEH